jgi:hypothetical protein
MELSPIQIAVAIVIILGFALTFLTSLVFFVVWLIRLEGRVSRSKERNDDEKTEREKLSNHLDRHIENADIHFNKQFFFEFKTKIESQLEGLGDSMQAGFDGMNEQLKELREAQALK